MANTKKMDCKLHRKECMHDKYAMVGRQEALRISGFLRMKRRNVMKKITWKRVDTALSRRLWEFVDFLQDKRICGQSLVKFVPSAFQDDANGIGMTGSQSTHYVILKKIFSHVTIHESDHFLDVGCGKGRVLAFMIQQKYACAMSGIEINEIPGKVAEEWTVRYEQICMMLGDAFLLDYNRYTVLYLNRPFLPKTFLEFVEKVESDLTHPITFIYWVDQQSGHLLKDRKGWTMHYREKLSRIYGIKIANCPQYYSIWTYEP